MLDDHQSLELKGTGPFMKHITCIEDLRELHKRRVPKAFFDYVDRGSYAEETLRANRDDLQDIKFRQRILVDVSKRDLSTTILGEPSALPLILAPVGLLGMQHGDGEIHACRAAQAAGIPFTQSTMSICSIEDIAAAVDKPFWFQLYVMKDRGFIKALIERAIAAKCSALVLTVDLQVIGQRHADIKNGMTVPPEWSLSKLFDFATKPAWVAGVLQGKRRTFGNLAGHLKVSDDITSLSTWISSQFDTTLNWKDVDWIRSIWPGKLILKGILDVEDAELAVKTGAPKPEADQYGLPVAAPTSGRFWAKAALASMRPPPSIVPSQTWTSSAPAQPSAVWSRNQPATVNELLAGTDAPPLGMSM